MQASEDQPSAGNFHHLYHHHCPSGINNNASPEIYSQTTPQVSIQSYNNYATLESSPAPNNYIVCNSPSTVSISSNVKSPFSPQGSSYHSDPHHSHSDNTYGSPASGTSVVDDCSNLTHILRELEMTLLGPESEFDDGCSCSHEGGSVLQALSSQFLNQTLDLKQGLVVCAEAISNDDIPTAKRWMDVLEPMVSVCGEPHQRLGAYLLEGLRARLLSSGSIIYKKLKCKEPTGPELMSYMHVLYQICPFYKFAYNSANVSILEAMENEKRIHIIDFQLAQGSQWMSLIKALSGRHGGPPSYIRVTGVDDSQSAIARGGNLDVVGRKLSDFAASLGVSFEFHGAAMDGCEVQLENLRVRPGEALAVNFPYMLHHMPDESVTTSNHRDRLIRLVKSLSPKIVTLVEQESNTNTSSFVFRFKETMDYYTAMFEAIDVGRPRDDKQRMSAEEHCVARDIVNMVACEGVERVERHEPLGKWRYRFMMAGFEQLPLSLSVSEAVSEVLKEYSDNFRAVVMDGAIYLGWKNRAMATTSAWR